MSTSLDFKQIYHKPHLYLSFLFLSLDRATVYLQQLLFVIPPEKEAEPQKASSPRRWPVIILNLKLDFRLILDYFTNVKFFFLIIQRALFPLHVALALLLQIIYIFWMVCVSRTYANIVIWTKFLLFVYLVNLRCIHNMQGINLVI